jgi:hypothetical protein
MAYQTVEWDFNPAFTTVTKLLNQAVKTDCKTLGNQMMRIARISATVLVLIACIAAELILLTYYAGYALGSGVHELNDRLAKPKVLASEMRAMLLEWLQKQRAKLLAYLSITL